MLVSLATDSPVATSLASVKSTRRTVSRGWPEEGPQTRSEGEGGASHHSNVPIGSDQYQHPSHEPATYVHVYSTLVNMYAYGNRRWDVQGQYLCTSLLLPGLAHLIKDIKECDNHYPYPSPFSKHTVKVTFPRLGRKNHTQSVKSKGKVIGYEIEYIKRKHLCTGGLKSGGPQLQDQQSTETSCQTPIVNDYTTTNCRQFIPYKQRHCTNSWHKLINLQKLNKMSSTLKLG